MSDKEGFRSVGSAGVVKNWISDIQYTWAFVGLLVTVPAVIYGASVQSAMALMAIVVFGFPTALAAFLLIKDRAWCFRLWRRVVVMGGVSAVTLVVVMQTDKLIPGMATPIVQAIERYKKDTGVYPATLAELSPKYLVELPAVRVAISQPDISYVVRDGQPRLVIPSAAGDGFANYEYNFEARAWVHNS